MHDHKRLALYMARQAPPPICARYCSLKCTYGRDALLVDVMPFVSDYARRRQFEVPRPITNLFSGHDIISR